MTGTPQPIPCAVCGRPAVSIVHVSDTRAEPRCADHQKPAT